MILYSDKDIKNNFDSKTYLRALEYQRIKCVKNVTITRDGKFIIALVRGTEKQPYAVSIDIENANGNIVFKGSCTCPMQFNCKHVAATLLEAMQEDTQKNTKISPTVLQVQGKDWLQEIIQKESDKNLNDFEGWFKNITMHLNSEKKSVEMTSHYHLLYLIELQVYRGEPHVKLNLTVARNLKKGGFGLDKRFSVSSMPHYRALLPVDHDILHRLEIIERTQTSYTRALYDDEYELSVEPAIEIFKDILKTNRCFWDNYQANPTPLKLGATEKGHLVWRMMESGEQKLICEVNGKAVTVLPFSALWYLDVAESICGPLTLALAPDLSKVLLFAPPVTPKDVSSFSNAIKKQIKTSEVNHIPLPQQFEKVLLEKVKPKPKLYLFGLTSSHYFFYRNFGKSMVIPLGRLSFLYDNIEISLNLPEKVEMMDHKTKVLKIIHRHFEEEASYINQLLQNTVAIFSKKYVGVQIPDIKNLDLLIGTLGDEASQESFLLEYVPKLKKMGWEVVVDPSYPVEYYVSADEWYTEVKETKEFDWFSMELGFLLEGQKVNLLPLLVQLIQQHPTDFTEKYLKTLSNDQCVLTLPQGQKVHIPVKRIKGILAVLTELYDEKSLNNSGQLPLSRLRATQVLELEKMMEVTRLRWMGGEKLLELSEKLKNFKGVESVKIPTTFIGKLRDYQQQGVDWLNFLREYRLGGILSDDMGLGKTVQTLAFILVEKHAKRLTKPCLIVAPTSLMSNWESETKQFTPSLTVLVLQGQERKQLFHEINKVDIVLTTYPLLVRDQDVLLEHEYEIIILDEAQNIKNALTKAYQILQQLKSNHRLCLTGTPMENHLGELWSLFNFLSPGLLGSSRQFTQLFRTPIEKQSHEGRRISLNQRIGPYMLRRTKAQVIKELPPKTEIIHKIVFEDAQRDLYESIRLSMESKIRKVIEDKGLARSQIIILDALLKLRQTCCDPRLLNLEHAKQVTESAKLTFLMDMLVELIEEGRKILLFSAFSSMLALIEKELQKKNISYVKLTGSTVDRKTPIQQFQGGVVPIFLISLKAGGTGLNLTAADTVIHYDPWWNPAAEAQATDRAHRIGQTKPVFVYKLVTTGTVEEKILLMQEKKRALLDSLFDEKTVSKAKLTKEDLNFLFQPIEEVEKNSRQ